MLKQIKIKDIAKFLILMAIGWSLIQVYRYLEFILAIFIFAAILAFILNYPISWLEKRLPRPLAVTSIFISAIFLVLGAIFTVTYAIVAQGPAFLEQVAAMLNVMSQLLIQLETFFDARGIMINANSLEAGFEKEILAQLGTTLTVVSDVLSNVAGLILTLVIAYFMLLDAEHLWKGVTRFIPTKHRATLIASIKQNFLGFFWGRIVLAFFLALASFIVFSLLKAPQPLFLALIIGIFDVIPGIGATLGIVLVALLLLPESFWLAGQVIVICIIFQNLETLLMPRVMQQSLKMSPVIVIFSLLIGHRIAGILGVILAIPTTAVFLELLPAASVQRADSQE